MSRRSRRCPATLGLAAALVLALGSVAYASDLGGIQRTVQLWLNGEMTDATLTVKNGHYTVNYTDSEGNERERSGGGVAFEPDGTERAGRFVFCSVIFITSVIVSGEACSGANARWNFSFSVIALLLLQNRSKLCPCAKKSCADGLLRDGEHRGDLRRRVSFVVKGLNLSMSCCVL